MRVNSIESKIRSEKSTRLSKTMSMRSSRSLRKISHPMTSPGTIIVLTIYGTGSLISGGPLTSFS